MKPLNLKLMGIKSIEFPDRDRILGTSIKKLSHILREQEERFL